jgi:catechol 2,3-dioxygenase-like lactoylglutathione lyase family enzyme
VQRRRATGAVWLSRADGLPHITFNVDDVDAEYSRLIAAGVASSQMPRDGHNIELFARVAFLTDPDGAMVELVQRQPGFTAGRAGTIALPA